MAAQTLNADIFDRSSLQHYLAYVTRYTLLLRRLKLMCLRNLSRRGVRRFVVLGLEFQVCSRSSLFLRSSTISRLRACILVWCFEHSCTAIILALL
jgi:hypothetical protein